MSSSPGASPSPAPTASSDPANASALEVAVVAIARRRAGEWSILLTRRAPGTHLAGPWELPGGKVERGESTDAAARREVREETGLRVRAIEPLIEVVHHYPRRSVRLHAHLAIVPGRTTVPAGRPLEHRWQPLDRLDEVAMPAANASITAALLARLARNCA